jgi:hypothetical protein
MFSTARQQREPVCIWRTFLHLSERFDQPTEPSVRGAAERGVNAEAGGVAVQAGQLLIVLRYGCVLEGQVLALAGATRDGMEDVVVKEDLAQRPPSATTDQLRRPRAHTRLD